ncbi:hypothetical protein OSTOST_06884 [Ostertagia ostertagi]
MTVNSRIRRLTTSKKPLNMRGPNQRIFSSSPKPSVLRHFYPKNSLEYENASISSTETSDNFLHPLIEVGSAIYDTLLWKNPMHTLLLVLTSDSTFFLGKEVAMPKFDITGAQLIFDVAKFAQKLLNFAANFLEKLHSDRFQFADLEGPPCNICFLLFSNLLACFVNDIQHLEHASECLTLGVRIFITTYLFHRFPRLRRRLDTYGWFYRNLPVKTSRDGSPVLVPGSEPSLTLASRAASPIPRKNTLNPNGTTGFAVECLTFARRTLPCPTLALKGSYDALNEQPTTNVQWAFSGQTESLTVEPTVSNFFNRPNRSRVSPLVTMEQWSPNPPADPLTSESTPRIEEDDEETTKNSNDDEEEALIIHEDQMIDNVLAYRSCVMNDKEKTFPKGISSGILYLTECALIYRTKSMSDDHAPLILLFADITSIKKIRSLRTVGLLTGTRKSLEIRMEGRRKALQFIGLAQRDDFYNRIQIVSGNDSNIEFL